MPLGNGELFLVQVPRNADDLHPVAQWLGNAGQRVRRRQEQHLGQVVIDLEEMVVERAVLLGIEHLEQRGRGIATPVTALLIMGSVLFTVSVLLFNRQGVVQR